MRHYTIPLLALLAVPLGWGQTSSGTARHIYYGTALPSKCSVSTGDVFFKTSSTIGIYQCGPTNNNWTLVAGVSAGGTVTQVDSGCGLTGGPISGTGTLKAAIAVDSQTGSTPFAIPSADCGKLISRNNAAGVLDTIAQATGAFGALWYAFYECLGAGGCTITPTTSTIDGATSLVMAQNQGVMIVSDGTNYFTVRGSGSAFQVNGAATTSNSPINFLNSNAFNGLTATFANPSAGGVKLGFSGTLNNAGLTNSSMTIAGHSVSLGGSQALASTDLSDTAVLVRSTDTGTVTNAMLAGSIANAKLANSSMTIAGHAVSLGGTQALAAADLSNGTTGTGAVVLAASPTLSGTATASALTLTGTLTTNVTGSTQCLHVNTSGVVSGTGSDCGSGGGATAWSAITNPSGNLALTMGADTSTFTFNATTGSSDLVKFTDTASNTGTGIMVHVTTASSSTEIPFQADANGKGWKVDASGNLSSVGATASGAAQFSGSSSGTVTVTVPAAAGTWTFSLPTGAAAAHQWLTTDTGGVASFTQPAFSDLSGSATCAQLPSLTGDTTTSAGSCATTTAKINGTAFSGTNGDVVIFGASNTPADAGFLATNVVRKDAVNTGAAAMTLNLAASTTADAFRVPVAAGATAGAAGSIVYDSTNTNLHIYDGADGIVAPFASAPTTGHCVQVTVSSGKVTLTDAGGACTTGGGGGTVASGTAPSLAYYATTGTTVSGSGIGYGTNNLQSTTSTQAVTYQGGIDASANSALGTVTVRGANETGAGGASSQGGGALVAGGSNAATNTASVGGSVELLAGPSTGATTGLQGLLLIAESYAQSGTVTQWNLECFTSTAKTVTDCGASPGNIAGVAVAKSGTVQVAVAATPSEVPVNASAAVTIGHTVCAGTTAGQVTDSGGTGPCATGITVGVVVATSGAWPAYPDGTTFPTLSTTLPLIRLANRHGVGTGDIANSSVDLTTKVTGILPGANGGTGNGFFAVSGPASSLKTFTFPNASATIGQVVASGSSLALGTSAISGNSCATVVTATATGTLTTDVISWTPNADWSGVTGYGDASTDGLIVYVYPTADTVNFKVCNGTGTSITPGAASINWRVAR